MARGGRVKECLRCHWRHPARLLAYFRSDVYIREEMPDVDGAEELDGEVLRRLRGLEVRFIAFMLRVALVGVGVWGGHCEHLGGTVSILMSRVSWGVGGGRAATLVRCIKRIWAFVYRRIERNYPILCPLYTLHAQPLAR